MRSKVVSKNNRQQKSKHQQQNRRNQAKKARMKTKQKLFAEAKQKIQTQYNTQPKQVHNTIFGKTAGKAKLTAVLEHETGNVLNKPEEVLQQVHKYFQNQANPAFGPKTGKFLPTEIVRSYPWAVGSHGNLDPYTIETKVGKPRYGKVSILDHIRCPSMFSARVRGLSNNKQPGPDGIPNELIKHLPEELHQAIHKLFVLMWLTGTTPRSWKESTTVLLHKKGSELDLNNYRPIALANTLYKLWTGVVQECMSRYAEHYDILSSQQEGFRKKRNTIRQLQNLLNALSDAKISNNDIYMLYVDFSSAFNTIDHDKLLCIMHDLVFTIDAIQAIRDLYTNATTIESSCHMKRQTLSTLTEEAYKETLFHLSCSWSSLSHC